MIKISSSSAHCLTVVAYTVSLERKVVGRIQNRWGPTRVGPFGLLQPLADGLKFIFKEDLTPPYVHKFLYILAPMLALTTALISVSLIPIGGWVTVAGVHTPIQITDTNISLLIILGVTSVGVYGIALAGWSSNRKYSMLGSLRASSQMVSYEVALGLSLVGVLILTGSFSLRDIVEHQAGWILELEHLQGRPVHRLLYLPDGGLRGNQPYSVRLAGSGIRTRRRIPHRIQFNEVRHVLHGRIREHGDGRLSRVDPVPRRIQWSDVRRSPTGVYLGAPAGVLVPVTRSLLPVPLHLGSRHVAALPLRPVDGVQLEVPAAAGAGKHYCYGLFCAVRA